MKSICLSLLVAAGTLIHTNAQQALTNTNPGLISYRALILSPKLEKADQDYLFTNDWRGQKIPDRASELLEKYNSEFETLKQASQSKAPCDWGFDVTIKGPETMLPHLAQCKAAAVAAKLRAQWHLQNNRQKEAIDDLLSAVYLGRNVSQDKITISGLVQFAMEAIVYNAVAENFGQFTPSSLKQLVDGINQAPARGSMAACIQTERQTFHDWFLNKINDLQKANPGNDDKVMAIIHQFLNEDQDKSETNQWANVVKASGGTSEGLKKLIRETEPFYARLGNIMALPVQDYEIQMKQFNTDVQQSQNPVVRWIFAAFEKCRNREFRIQVYEAMVKAAIACKLQGESGLQSVIDPYSKAPFAFQRFVFEGVDRGFQLKSTFIYDKSEFALIFVEKQGTPFRVDGPFIGQALTK